MGIKISPKVPWCYLEVKYEEAEVHRSTIMQDSRDNEKTNKTADWRPFWIL